VVTVDKKLAPVKPCTKNIFTLSGKLFILRRMDFKTIISDLQQRGYTMAMIAESIGTTRANVAAILRNTDQQPRWVTGNKLIELHKRVMKRKAAVN
jgi:hypothetical protein